MSQHSDRFLKLAAEAKAQIREIPPHDAAALFADGKAVLIDVRETDEHAHGTAARTGTKLHSPCKSLRRENNDLKKTLEARKTIERAKGILMKTQRLSEAEAFSLIQKRSMDLRKSMAEIAQAIILTDELTR
jgi:rhodanese-related sulfurtransferase